MAIDTIGPYAVQPIRDFLSGFTPVQKSVVDADCATLTYDILNWSFAPAQPPPCPNSVYGSVSIGCGEGGAYRIRQQTHIGGEPTVFEADVICNPRRYPQILDAVYLSRRCRGGADSDF